MVLNYISTYAIVDPTDNSVTLSRKLFKIMERYADETGKSLDRICVYGCLLQGVYYFGFKIDPEEFKDAEDSTFYPLQQDTKSKHIGFHDCYVNQMCYRWYMNMSHPMKVLVKVRKIDNELRFDFVK